MHALSHRSACTINPDDKSLRVEGHYLRAAHLALFDQHRHFLPRYNVHSKPCVAGFGQLRVIVDVGLNPACPSLSLTYANFTQVSSGI